jgi:hypothetical protein
MLLSTAESMFNLKLVTAIVASRKPTSIDGTSPSIEKQCQTGESGHGVTR